MDSYSHGLLNMLIVHIAENEGILSRHISDESKDALIFTSSRKDDLIIRIQNKAIN